MTGTVSSHSGDTWTRSSLFDALTGTGLRDRAYTWTAAAYLLLAESHRPDRP
jgi:hypothetical protein